MKGLLILAGGVLFGGALALAGPIPAQGQATVACPAIDGPETLTAGTAGTAPNMNDCVWVLERGPAGKDGRPVKHLALYRVVANGKDEALLQLVDARQIDWDLRLVQLSKASPTVAEVKKAVEKAEEEERKKEAAPAGGGGRPK